MILRRGGNTKPQTQGACEKGESETKKFRTRCKRKHRGKCKGGQHKGNQSASPTWNGRGKKRDRVQRENGERGRSSMTGEEISDILSWLTAPCRVKHLGGGK